MAIKSKQEKQINKHERTKKQIKYDVKRLAPQIKEVSTLTGMEYAPRSIKKELANEWGSIKTQVDNRATLVDGVSPSTPLPAENIKMEKQDSSFKEKDETNAKYNIVAGNSIKSSGTTMGVAYFTAVSIGKYDNKKVRISGEKILTGTAAETAAKARAMQSTMKENYNQSIIQKAVIESKVTFYSELSKYQNKSVNLFKLAGQGFAHGSRDALGKGQNLLGRNEDMGTQAASSVIGAGFTTYSVVRTAQNASPVLVGAVINTPKRIVSLGRGTWDVTSTVGRATVSVVKTTGFIQTGFVSLNSEALSILRLQTQLTGLNTTMLSKRIIHRVESIQNRVTTIKTGIVTATNAIKYGTTISYSVVRGIATGKGFGAVSSLALNDMRNALIQGIKTGAIRSIKTAGKGTIHASIQGGVWAYYKGIPKVSNIASDAVGGIGNVLGKTDNMALQGVGGAINIARYGVKTAKFSTKVTHKTVLTSAKVITKTAKNTWYTANFFRKNGWRVSYHHVGKKAGKALYGAGKSIITTIINTIKALGTKVAIPLLLIVAIVLGGANVVTAPISVLAAIFGSTFSTTEDGKTYIDYDVREYISNPDYGIPALRTAYINDLYNYMKRKQKSNGGKYTSVYFKTNTDDTKATPSIASISNVFYSEQDLENIIQPIFNAVILKDYDLAPTEKEARDVLKEIFDSLFRITEKETKHTSTYSDGSKKRWYTLTVTLNMDGLYELLAKYFTDPIDKLANNTNRTKEQDEQLQMLKDYYEICLEYISQVSELYSGGLSMDDLSGVVWINGTRTGNQAVIDLALSQVGQMGGQPYWSWYGFNSRVEWCACFVSWCMSQSGHGEIKYASCQYGGVPYFQNQGCWASGNSKDIVAGDVIFFDWDGDGKANHTGLVIGTDGEFVYTVEGNSGDACTTRKYPVGSSVIMGYGLVNN